MRELGKITSSNANTGVPSALGPKKRSSSSVLLIGIVATLVESLSCSPSFGQTGVPALETASISRTIGVIPEDIVWLREKTQKSYEKGVLGAVDEARKFQREPPIKETLSLENVLSIRKRIQAGNPESQKIGWAFEGKIGLLLLAELEYRQAEIGPEEGFEGFIQTSVGTDYFFEKIIPWEIRNSEEAIENEFFNLYDRLNDLRRSSAVINKSKCLEIRIFLEKIRSQKNYYYDFPLPDKILADFMEIASRERLENGTSEFEPIRRSIKSIGNLKREIAFIRSWEIYEKRGIGADFQTLVSRAYNEALLLQRKSNLIDRMDVQSGNIQHAVQIAGSPVNISKAMTDSGKSYQLGMDVQRIVDQKYRGIAQMFFENSTLLQQQTPGQQLSGKIRKTSIQIRKERGFLLEKSSLGFEFFLEQPKDSIRIDEAEWIDRTYQLYGTRFEIVAILKNGTVAELTMELNLPEFLSGSGKPSAPTGLSGGFGEVGRDFILSLRQYRDALFEERELRKRYSGQ